MVALLLMFLEGAHDEVRSSMSRRGATSSTQREIEDEELSMTSRSEVMRVILSRVNDLHADLQVRNSGRKGAPVAQSASAAVANGRTVHVEVEVASQSGRFGDGSV